MLRFIAYIMGLRDYEGCKSCETLKQQLDLSNAYNKELTDTLLGLIKPSTVEASPVELQPIVPRGGLWSKRREALEAADRLKAQTMRNSQFVAKPDKVSASGMREIIPNKERERDDQDIASLEDELKIAENK